MKKRLSKKELVRLAMRRMRDRERRFKKMSPERKRVAIARDVIANLAAQKIKAESGVWLSVYPEEDVKKTLSGDDQLQAVLTQTSCTACALGALFACTVQRANDFEVGRAGHVQYEGSGREIKEIGVCSFSEISRYLDRFFDKFQLAQIEAAFELKTCDVLGMNSWDAYNFGNRFDSDSDRMVAIMENIVRNNGKFVPTDLRP